MTEPANKVTRIDKLMERGKKIAARFDGWANVLTGLSRSRDKRTAATIEAARIWTGEELDEIYAGSDLIATLVDLPANEMVREWVTIKTPDEEKTGAGAALLEAFGDLDAQSAFGEAETMARLTGGSVIMLGIDDNADDVEEPLDEDNIQSVRWLEVFDRFDLQIVEVYGDPTQPKFGLPSVYRIIRNSTAANKLADHGNGGDTLIHETRLLVFRGVRTTRRRREVLDGWDDSVVTRAEIPIRDLEASFHSLAHLMLDMSQAVYKIKGLANLLAADQDDLVVKRLQFMDMARSVLRAIPLDADGEEFIRQATPLSGVPDAIDRLMSSAAGAARMPITLLFGESPGGLNATGATDLRFFYDGIRAQQVTKIGAPLRRLGGLLYRAKDGPTGGDEPESWTIEFLPLWAPTPKDKADTNKLNAETDALYLDRAVISPSEVAASRFAPGLGGDIIIDPDEPRPDEDADDPDETGDDIDPTPEPEAEPTDEGEAMPEEAVDPTTALNGAQVTAMLDIVGRVALGELPRETGVEIIAAAFPLDREAAGRVMGEVGKTFFVETAPAPAPAPGVPTPPDPDPDPEEPEETGSSHEPDDPEDDDGNTGHESGHESGHEEDE